MAKKSVWRDKDPIATVMRQTGKTRLEVLEGIREAMLSRHADELARNPKAPRALENLNRMIEAARTTCN